MKESDSSASNQDPQDPAEPSPELIIKWPRRHLAEEGDEITLTDFGPLVEVTENDSEILVNLMSHRHHPDSYEVWLNDQQLCAPTERSDGKDALAAYGEYQSRWALPAEAGTAGANTERTEKGMRVRFPKIDRLSPRD